LKRIAIALLSAPVFVLAQTQVRPPMPPEACYLGKSTKSEVLEAIACFKANPATGSAVVNQFKREQADLVSTDSDVAAAFKELEGALRQKAKELADRVAAEQKRAELVREEERKSKALNEMARAALGSEDTCRRPGFAAVADSDFAAIDCQFAGKLNLSDLKGVGWLVVNKTRDADNVVREYFIRKVR
jgi:hypothetical protein